MALSPKVLEVVQAVSKFDLFELAEFVGTFELDWEVSKLAHVIAESLNPATIATKILTESKPWRVMVWKSAQKIQTIKVVRALTGWGLKESKDWVDALPDSEWVVVTSFASHDEAHAALDIAMNTPVGYGVGESMSKYFTVLKEI